MAWQVRGCRQPLGAGCCAEATVGSELPGSHPLAQAADPRSWCPLIRQVGAELSSHLCTPHWDLQRLAHTLTSREVCSLLTSEATYTNDEVSQVTLRSTLAQYTDALHPGTFHAMRDILMEHHQDPEGIQEYENNRSVIIVASTTTFRKSLLMMTDAFPPAQLGLASRASSCARQGADGPAWGHGAHPTVPDEQLPDEGPSSSSSWTSPRGWR